MAIDRIVVTEEIAKAPFGVEVHVAEETAQRWKEAIADYDRA